MKGGITVLVGQEYFVKPEFKRDWRDASHLVTSVTEEYFTDGYQREWSLDKLFMYYLKEENYEIS